MTDEQIDEALEAFSIVEDAASEYGDGGLPEEKADIEHAIHFVRKTLERQREEIDALSRLNRALDEKLAALERQRDRDQQLKRLFDTFRHTHKNNGVDDACAMCGLDLRNSIHAAAPEPSDA